jgi:serine O-acetyltransferase
MKNFIYKHIKKLLTKKNSLPFDRRLILACDIGQDISSLLRRGVAFDHPVGIVIAKNAWIGDNCRIWQNVTIGAKDFDSCDITKYPKIGENVKIYAGAVIIGDVRIGNNAVIGANAVVLNDIPENATVAGIPAKLIQKTNNV